ncbi:hypothetical protein [Cohaesibacter haloalkalitolerans]|uniref:hypothetical protein n=1 Tax=Cohaesibacter haloalkalitolerans TaxID=1162980 RepID=UPI000E654C8C|nr:hypothetical protein [Cohaesibacter haloalkalitolerans]
MTALIGQELLLIILAVIIGALLGCALRAFLASKQGQDLTNRAEALYDPAAAAARKAAEAFPLEAAEGASAAEADSAAAASVAMTGAPVPGGREAPLPVEQSVVPVEEMAPAASAEGKAQETIAPETKAYDTSVDPTKVAEGMAGEGLLDKAPEAQDDASKDAPDPAAASSGAISETEARTEEQKLEQALAALPKGATAQQKAEAVGTKPLALEAPIEGKADDLKQIKGIGKVIEGKLNAMGIYHFKQIADWDRGEVNYVSTFLSFKGRIDRENWVAQAKLLSSGQATAFSMRVAKGEVESSRS